MRSQSIAISFMSAMLTERKMFSSSFASSAASGAETRHERVDGLARRARTARSVQAGVRPPTTFGIVRDGEVGAARVDALGRHREVEVDARHEARTRSRASGPCARASCRGRSSTRARSGARGAGAGRSTRSRRVMYERSGSRFSVSGVGTQTIDVVAAPRPRRSRRSRAGGRASTSRASVSGVTSLMYESPALMRATRPASGSTQSTAWPASAKRDGERQADVAGPDDGDACVHDDAA